MGYVAYNRGFKSAVFNTVVFPSAPIAKPVNPETLDDFSIGAKSEFFDHRVRLNAEAFYYDYKNVQINQILNGLSVLSNAAAATIKGIDIDTTIVPITGLTVTAAIEVLDGHYNSYPNGLLWVYAPGCAPASTNCNPAVAPDLSGNKTIDTPPFSASFTVNYLQHTDMGELEYNLAYSHGGDYFFDPDNGRGQLSPALDKQPKLNLVNASIGWSSHNEKYNVRLWGKNIFGQKYIAFGTESQFGTQQGPAPPATYGITVGVHLK
jgi:iron complex outermembrane receptor protein